MSRNVKNVKNSAPMQKYCKVCHDAGKSESEYRSHFLRESRDPNSRIVCPTLLSLECRYCFEKGHTVKYCAVLKKKERSTSSVHNNAQKKATEKPKGEKPKGKSTNHNIFAVLASDSEESEEEVTIWKSRETSGRRRSITSVWAFLSYMARFGP